MVPLALVVLVVAIVLTIKEKTWLCSGFVFIAGLLVASTPWGRQILNVINSIVNWAISLFS